MLLHTLLFRVEQVFLIHKETGCFYIRPRLRVRPCRTPIWDFGGDGYSGFRHDSFTTDRGDELETFQVGELTVWQRSLAVLAGVIRAPLPGSQSRLQETLNEFTFSLAQR